MITCIVCEQDGRSVEAVRLIEGTRDGVCQGHALPALLAGHGLERIRASVGAVE